MHFVEDNLYHIYNRGNNRQPIFFTPKNYLFFLHKVRRYIKPYCHLLAYCLMPNHFHFLIQATSASTVLTHTQLGSRTALSEGVKNLLSSYTQAINKQEIRTGSLFAQNTKAKLVSHRETEIDYSLLCLNYIHQNPLRAGLVQEVKDWPYSSFPDYAHLRRGTLCEKEITYGLIDADWTHFTDFSAEILPEGVDQKLY